MKKHLLSRVVLMAVALGVAVAPSVVSPAPAQAAGACITRNFGPGWAGNDRNCVLYLQYMLNQAKIYPAGTPDGIFGPRTEDAVIYYQKYTPHNLVPDGVVGPKTWAALCQDNGPTGYASAAGCRW